jgi:HK97 family phage prohead protease
MLEHRSLNWDDCEIKMDDAGGGTFEGYASVFGGNDSYDDTIEAGAFSKTLKGRKRPPLMLYSHDPRSVIGKYPMLKEDKKGLFVHGEFTPNHTEAQNVRASMMHDAIDGLSIGFALRKGDYELKDPEDPFGGRIIKNLDLREISVVAMPADDAARTTDVKAEVELMESITDVEHVLRDAGFSRSAAMAFVSRFKGIVQCDTESLKEEIAALQERLEGGRLNGVKEQLTAFKSLLN